MTRHIFCEGILSVITSREGLFHICCQYFGISVRLGLYLTRTAACPHTFHQVGFLLLFFYGVGRKKDHLSLLNLSVAAAVHVGIGQMG